MYKKKFKTSHILALVALVASSFILFQINYNTYVVYEKSYNTFVISDDEGYEQKLYQEESIDGDEVGHNTFVISDDEGYEQKLHQEENIDGDEVGNVLEELVTQHTLHEIPKPRIPTMIDVNEDERKLQVKIQSLEQMDPIPFYIYDHPNITLHKEFLKKNKPKLDRLGYEVVNDFATIYTLRTSPWKTTNPKEAKLFFIPIPMGRIELSARNEEFYNMSFSTLVNDPIFQETMGHRHVLLASPWWLFRGDWYAKYGTWGQMKTWLPYLWNVTVAQSYDQNAIINALREDKEHDFKEYTKNFQSLVPLNKKTFSVGLSGGTEIPLFFFVGNIFPPDNGTQRWKKFEFPLTLASIHKFDKSSNFIFYHTREAPPSFHNSTIFRHAPITNITMSDFPKSSIGFGIDDKDVWLQTYKDSKFCLCIRG